MSSFSGPLPENIRRRMSQEQRNEMKCPTQTEADAKLEAKREREMHDQFESWLRRNKIAYVHSRMDRKSTIREGWPDFTVMTPYRVCFVEFKMTGRGLTDQQGQCCSELILQGHDVEVCFSYAYAVKWTMKTLGIT